jgi:hypothetical protein
MSDDIWHWALLLTEVFVFVVNYRPVPIIINCMTNVATNVFATVS